MVISDCPQIYVSRSRNGRAAFRAAHGGQRVAVGDTVERDHRFANEIEGPSDLAMPQTPANPIDDFNEIRTRLAIVRPAFGSLINMLNPHRKVESVKHMMSWARTGRFAQRARTFRPIAENRDRGDRRAQFMNNATQLVLLRNSLHRHAAEDDLLSAVICDLGEQDFERACLIMTNRSDMATIDGKRDRFCLDRAWFRVVASFSRLAPTDRALAGRLHRRNVVERQNPRHQCPGTAVRQRSSHHRDNTLVLRCARSGMVSLTGLRVWRRVTAQRHGSNRGAETFTVPNKDKRRRDRVSLMGRGPPHPWHRRRRRQ